jgi:hypothetical protein
MYAFTMMFTLLAQGPAEACDERVGLFTAERFRAHVAFLGSDNLKGRKAGSEGAAKAAQYIAAKFKEAQLKPAVDDGTYFQGFTIHDEVKGRSVLGIRPGAGALAGEHVIVSAHLDHLGVADGEAGRDKDLIYNGADDDASGVAAMLLIAEDLARDRGGPDDPQRRTVVFAAFDAEEIGLLGACHYAERPSFPLEQTAVVLNFDMVGRLGRGRLFVTDAETSTELGKSVRDRAKSIGVPVETRVGGNYRGDQAVFLRRQIPSVQFFTGLHADYHEVTDEVAALDCEGGARIAALGASVALFAASHPVRFEYRRVAPAFDVRAALTLARRLGVVPALGAQPGRGPTLLFVTPGGIAARKGLRSGDSIAAINGLLLDKPEDALLALAQVRFDQNQRMTVRRGGTSFEIRAEAGEFAVLEGPPLTPAPGGRFGATFQFTPPAGVKTVYLGGDFGAFKAFEMKKMEGPGSGGRYTLKVVLDAGEYHYNFQCQGGGKEGSYPDPDNLQQDEFGNSVLRVAPAVQAGQKP